MGRKRKCWSESFGTQGYRVRIFERAPGGPLWYEHRRPGRLEGSPLERASLKHRDRIAAKQWSLRRSDELRVGLCGVWRQLLRQPARGSDELPGRLPAGLW